LFSSFFLQAEDNDWILTQPRNIDLTKKGYGIEEVPSLLWQSGHVRFHPYLVEAEKDCALHHARVPTLHEVYALYEQKDLLETGLNNWHGSSKIAKGYAILNLSVDFQGGGILASFYGTSYRCVRSLGK
jgi:hypothetical protein